jgi:hypothetical protein
MDTTTFNPDNPSEPMTQVTALNIKAYASDTLAGEVTGLPNHPLFTGDTINLQATAKDDCYRFVKWSDNITTNPRHITLTTSTSYVAIFESKKVTISTSSVNIDNDEEEGGTTNIYY